MKHIMDKFSNFLLTVLGHALLHLEMIIAVQSETGASLHRELIYPIDMTQVKQVGHLSDIINALENLGVLESSHTICYSLDKVTKIVEGNSDLAWKVGINFHVRELAAGSRVEGGTNAEVVTEPNHKGCITKHQHNDHQVELPEFDSEKGSNSSSYVTEDGLIGVDMELHRNSSQNPTDAAVVSHDESTLSLAQIMVISTCSTVIGLFFLVAFAMRTRNCIKRRRELQKNRRRAFRHSEVTVRSRKGTLADITVHNTTTETNKPTKPARVADGARALPIDHYQWYGREYLLSM